MNSYKKTKLLLPAVVFVILPLTAVYQVCESRFAEFTWSSGAEKHADMFLYGKQQLFSVLAFCFLFVIIVHWIKEKITTDIISGKQWYMMIPAFAYLLLAFLSSVCSSYRTAAFLGSDDQYESFFCLAGYILFMAFLTLLVKNKQDIKMIGILIGISSLLQGMLGLLQYAGCDPFQWEWLQRLILPEGYLETYGQAASIFENGRVFLAAYNPNYAGVLLAMLGSFFLGLLLTERRIKLFVAELVVFLLLLISLVGTGSKAGLLVFAGVSVLLFLFLALKKMKYRKLLLIAGAALILVVGLAINFSKLPLMDSLKAALSLQKNAENPLEEITTSKDGIHLTYQGKNILITYLVENGGYYVTATDSDGNESGLVTSQESMSYTFTDPALQNISIHPLLVQENYGMLLNIDGTPWAFIEQDGQYFYINTYGRMEQLEPIRRIGFDGYETLATSRGLIWSATLPLLKDHLLLGSGANTFVFEYPQTNYKDMYFYNGEIEVAVRPHNMYLQTAIESGIPALACLLVFWGWYILQTLSCLRNADLSDTSGRISLACLSAVTAYLVCGLTNDSMITVAPVFWGILGLGIATNLQLKSENSKQ